MLCKQCGVEFEPAKEVGRLIEIGQIPRVCDSCAKPAPSVFRSARPVVSTKRTCISVLCRVDKFDPDGIVRQWMSLMPIPKSGKKRIPRPGRVGDWLRVFVMSMSERSNKMTGHPNTKLFTNFETFQQQGQPFRAWKAPGRADVLTGIDSIELEVTNLDRVVDDGSLEINIFGRDGSRIHLLYKN